MAHTAGLVLACVLASAAAVAQEPSSPEPSTDPPSTAAQTVASETPISPKQFTANILHDQKPIWTFPWKVVKGKHWKPVLVVALGTAGLVVADPYTEPYFHNASRFGSYKT
jgi:hypothetical protein